MLVCLEVQTDNRQDENIEINFFRPKIIHVTHVAVALPPHHGLDCPELHQPPPHAGVQERLGCYRNES